ncbi:chromosomal replication initiator protein DnaA [Candidatus Phytoplasma pyri]|uniref:chromosomal replication initiator protein DnaA n=1 Tax=Candidatus Phytoplasma pyri TaxID=47566 RepID=UPI003983B754
MKKYNYIWEKILEEISKIYSDKVFNETFKNTKKVYKYENKIIFILTENEFIKNKIYKIYLSKINEISKIFFKEENLNFKFITKNEINEIKEEKIDKKEYNIYNYGNLNQKYNFKNFIIGESNKFAFEMSKKISENEKIKINPLYIFGNVGLGKTHLLHSIGNKIIENNKEKKVLYVKADEFIEDFINQLKEEKIENFKLKYRNIDVLLMDDIQIMSEAKRTQIEFFKLFDYLYLNNKQIVITSDKNTSELKNIMSRLISRFEAGLIIDIKKPDFKHRINILNQKMYEFEIKKIKINKEILELIASCFVNNIREMEGALLRLFNYIQTYKDEIDLNIAKEILKPLLKGKINNFKNKSYKKKYLEKINIIISSFYNIEINELLGKKKHQKYTLPRHISMYLSKKLYKFSYNEIGNFFKKNHSAISKGCKKIEKNIEQNTEFKKSVDFIIKKIKSKEETEEI